MQSLENVFEFLHQFMALHQLKKETSHTIDLVVEELFTNIVKYGGATSEPITISIEEEAKQMVISVIDPNSKPFDITTLAEPNLDLPLHERKPGGLGILLVKQMTDSVQYEHQNGTTIITVTKRLD